MTTFESPRQELKNRFDINGFVNFGRILQDDEVQALSDRVNEISDGTVPSNEGSLRFHPDWEEKGMSRREGVWQIMNAHLYDDIVREVCEKPVIREAIELFIEGPAEVWSTQVITKPAHHGTIVPWHQDTSYWGEEKRMTCWLAIDDATPFNGCMRMIAGSHLAGQLAYKEKQFEGVNVSLRETVEINEDTQVYVPVRSGCASFHHPLTLHASDANTTPYNRRAIAITYMKSVE